MRYKDLTGLRIGKLTVLEPTAERVRNAVVWKCRCDCGQEILVESRKLKPGAIYSCGCEESPVTVGKDLTGLRFGKLTVLKKSENRAKDGNPLWVCRCDCGNTVDVRQSNLQSGTTTSCGCRRSPQKNLHYTEGTCLEMLRTDTMYKTNTSGVRGVYYSSKRHKWIAQIMFKKKCYYLGGYDSLDDAAKVRAAAEEKVFGDFVKWYGENYRQNAISPAISRTSV